LGWLADRVHRVRLVAGAIVLWSAATTASGLAQSFHALFLARMCVGVGEAALFPAAISIFADLFPPHRRALPLAVFSGGAAIGNGLALALGGALVAYAAHGVASFPLLGAWLAAQHGWQDVFILLGLIGLPVAAIVLCLTEPSRDGGSATVVRASTAQGAAYMKTHWRLFLPLLAGAGLIFLFSYSLQAWGPTLFIRKFHWAAPMVGKKLGAIVLASALSGTICSGLLMTWLSKRYPLDAPVRTMMLAVSLLLPLAILAPLSPNPNLLLGALAATNFIMALAFGTSSATLVAVTPNWLRGQVVALYLLIGSLVGMGLGPLSVGRLLDILPGGPAKIGVALSMMAVIALVPSLLLLILAKLSYTARAREIALERAA
jgi:MFS family permease